MARPRLTSRRIALLARALLDILRARAALAFLPWSRASRDPAIRPAASLVPGEAAWAVQAVARRLPGTHCLARALALRALLAHGGHAVALRLGVAKPEDGGLAAHAWIVCGEETFDCGEDPGRYAAFPAAR